MSFEVENQTVASFKGSDLSRNGLEVSSRNPCKCITFGLRVCSWHTRYHIPSTTPSPYRYHHHHHHLTHTHAHTHTWTVSTFRLTLFTQSSNVEFQIPREVKSRFFFGVFFVSVGIKQPRIMLVKVGLSRTK